MDGSEGLIRNHKNLVGKLDNACLGHSAEIFDLPDFENVWEIRSRLFICSSLYELSITVKSYNVGVRSDF